MEENIDKKSQEKIQEKGPGGKGKTSIARESEKENESTNSQGSRSGNGIGRVGDSKEEKVSILLLSTYVE